MAGQFDAVLVPVRSAGELFDRWVLAVNADLATSDQVALYGHALGHLLLNHDMQQLGRPLPLDPGNGYAHVDGLAELRLVDQLPRSPADRRVLETFRALTELLLTREERPIAPAEVADLRQRLGQRGWRGTAVEAPYTLTSGRVFVTGTSVRRGRKLRVSCLLRAEASLPIAVVQSERPGEAREEAAQRLTAVARDRLHLPFAYLMGDDGVEEFDFTASPTLARCRLDAVPEQPALLNRWLISVGLNNPPARPHGAALPVPRRPAPAALLPGSRDQPGDRRHSPGQARPAPAARLADPRDRDGQDQDRVPDRLEAQTVPRDRERVVHHRP